MLSEIRLSFYEDVVQILARLEEAFIDTVRGRRAGDRLMVGSTPMLASAWLVPRMRDFAGRFSDISFELMTVADTIDLETSPVDVAIMRGAGQ